MNFEYCPHFFRFYLFSKDAMANKQYSKDACQLAQQDVQHHRIEQGPVKRMPNCHYLTHNPYRKKRWVNKMKVR